MVNSITPSGIPAADLAPKASTGITPIKAPPPVAQPTPAAPVVEKQAPVQISGPVQAAPLVPSEPLAPPLTSLALWRDSESGMQMAVVRDRVTGKVVDEFPTERARRLAVMVRQQEAMAQELHNEQVGTPRVDLKT